MFSSAGTGSNFELVLDIASQKPAVLTLDALSTEGDHSLMPRLLFFLPEDLLAADTCGAGSIPWDFVGTHTSDAVISLSYLSGRREVHRGITECLRKESCF
jgi:hypothetical protein